MTEPTIKKNSQDQCSYCGGVFSNDILNLLEKNISPIYCEFCGTEIKKVKKEDKSDLNVQKSEDTANSIPFNITETIQTPSPQGEIYFDPDFSQIFKDNLIIVLSRIIYFNISNLYQIEELKANKMELSESILNNIAKSLEPIMTKRIRINFLGKLRHISIKKFEKQIKKLQLKTQTHQNYQNSFKIYLRWLISIVFNLITDKWDDKYLPKFEETILKDLKNYGFDIYNKEVKNNGIKNPLEPQEEQNRFESINFTNYYRAKLTLELRNLSSKYEDSELLFVVVKNILTDLISEPFILTKEDLASRYRSNPLYLASALIYYGLRHEIYNSQQKRFKLYGIYNFLNENYPNNTKMKSAMIYLVPKIYEYLSDSLKMKILYYPMKGHKIRQEILDKVKYLRDLEKNGKFNRKIVTNLQEFSKRLPNAKLILNLAMNILKDAQNQPRQFSYTEINEKNRWFSSPRFISIVILYLAYNHTNSQIPVPLNIAEFSEKFFKKYKSSNQANISFIYEYLSPKLKKKIRYYPQEIYHKNRPFNIDKMWIYLEKFLLIFSNKNEYQNRAKEIYLDALSNGFNPNDLVSKHPKYLGAALAYFTLIDTKDPELLKIKYLNLLNENGYHFESIIYKVMKELERFIAIKSPITIYNSEKFRAELNRISKHYKNIRRYDNIILIDLILKILDFYKGKFALFIRDLNFISKKRKASSLLEKLSNPNVFNTESNMMYFISGYKRLINCLGIEKPKQLELYSLLDNFERERRLYYKYNERKSEKKQRKKKRYQKYTNYFYSHKIRVQRFLLMLGFSPFDGFDIWGNKIFTKRRYRIYANFHHYHYKPEEQSKKDLLFIPVKPPISYRKGEYLTKKYLTHNVISGLEGNLKRTDISDKVRSKIINKLQNIEEIIEFNSKLILKAMYSLKPEILYSLKNWKKNDVNRVISRLKDYSFSWCKGIEQYLPTAGGYDYERIDHRETKEIIQGISNKRKNSS